MAQFEPPPLPSSAYTNPLVVDGPVVALCRHWLTVVTLILLAAVVVLQRPEAHDPKEDEIARQAAAVTAPHMGPFILLGKMLVAFKDDVPNMGSLVRSQLDQPSFGTPAPEDEVRVVMLLIGTGQAQAPAGPPSPAIFGGSGDPPRTLPQVLDEVEKGLAPTSPLHEDLKVVRPLLEVALRDQATEKDIQAAVETLDAATREGLQARHGWFAEVLLTRRERVPRPFASRPRLRPCSSRCSSSSSASSSSPRSSPDWCC